MGWFGSDKQLLFTSENPKEQIRIMTPRVQLLAISWFAGRNTLIFLLSVLLWCLLIIETIIHPGVCKWGGYVQSHKAACKISSMLREMDFYFCFCKIPLEQVKARQSERGL